MGFFSKELKNEFETAVINEPSVFEPLKVYCIYLSCKSHPGMDKLFISLYLLLFQNASQILYVIANLKDAKMMR